MNRLFSISHEMERILILFLDKANGAFNVPLTSHVRRDIMHLMTEIGGTRSKEPSTRYIRKNGK
jgi:hypothetical protein